MSKTLSILIVEDNFELGELFVEILTTDDNQVELIRDGQIALDYLSDADKTPPHVVILDMNLPHVSGEELLKYIRSQDRYKSTRVVVITANAIMNTIVDDLADIVLLKPVSYEQINSLINRLSPPSA